MSAEKERKDNTSLVALILLGLGVIIIFAAPYLFTQYSSSNVSYEGTGQIGDTIGGISGPFLSLIGSALVFLALKAQVKANELVQQQIKAEELERNFRLIFEEIKELEKSINEFSIVRITERENGPQRVSFHSKDAINLLIEESLVVTNPDTTSIKSFMERFNRIFLMRGNLPTSDFQKRLINGDLRVVFISNFSGQADVIAKVNLDPSHPLVDRRNEMLEILNRLPV